MTLFESSSFGFLLRGNHQFVLHTIRRLTQVLCDGRLCMELLMGKQTQSQNINARHKTQTPKNRMLSPTNIFQENVTLDHYARLRDYGALTFPLGSQNECNCNESKSAPIYTLSSCNARFSVFSRTSLIADSKMLPSSFTFTRETFIRTR